MDGTLQASSFTPKEQHILLQTFATSTEILDPQNNTVLHMAVALREFPDLVALLLAKKPHLANYTNCANAKGVTPLILAFHVQNIGALQTFGLLGTTPAVRIIRIPAQNMGQHNVSIITKLAQSQKGIPQSFTLSEKAKLLEIFKAFEAVDDNGNTPLHLAAGLTDFPELTAQLLARNPELIQNINTINNQGFTPLDLAHLKGNPEAIKALQASGANP